MSRPVICECARLATLAVDEKASLPGGAFLVEAPALGETNRAVRLPLCCGLVGGLFWGARFRTPREQRLAGRPTIS